MSQLDIVNFDFRLEQQVGQFGHVKFPKLCPNEVRMKSPPNIVNHDEPMKSPTPLSPWCDSSSRPTDF